MKLNILCKYYNFLIIFSFWGPKDLLNAHHSPCRLKAMPLFHINAAISADTVSDHTDSEKDYDYQERPISSSNSSDSNSRSDGEGDTGGIILRE